MEAQCTWETYHIFDSSTGEFVGDVLACSISDAEFVASGTFFDHSELAMFAVRASDF